MTLCSLLLHGSLVFHFSRVPFRGFMLNVDSVRSLVLRTENLILKQIAAVLHRWDVDTSSW